MNNDGKEMRSFYITERYWESVWKENELDEHHHCPRLCRVPKPRFWDPQVSLVSRMSWVACFLALGAVWVVWAPLQEVGLPLH